MKIVKILVVTIFLLLFFSPILLGYLVSLEYITRPEALLILKRLCVPAVILCVPSLIYMMKK